MNEQRSLADRLNALNEGEILLPREFLSRVVFPQVAMTCLGLTIVYHAVLSLSWAARPAPSKGDKKGKLDGITQRRKACYQFTNFCANLILTLAGFYFEYVTIPKHYQQQPLTPEQTTQGFTDIVFMSTFQMGFQFWAIPVGILHIGESPAMIAHHVTVIVVSAMSGFLRNGFRYWTPFFYGMIEASSLFLSVMNYCKDNPHWIESHPRAYAVLRLAFAVAFLGLRVIMFTPRLFTYASHQFWLFSQHPSTPYRLFMGLSWLSSIFLLLLQWYWATLIVRGIMKQIVIRGKKEL